MKHVAVLMIVGTALFGGAASALGFHEEAQRALGDVVDQFRGLGAQLERHLYGGSGRTGAEPASPAERPLISFILDHREELQLSPDQASRLEVLRSSFAREAIRREADVRIAQMDLSALLDRDPLDMAQVEAKIREVAQLRADLRIARLKTLEQGKAVLTTEQRTRLQGLLGAAARPARRTAADGTRL
jgi:Spy/CpxP family protein refolding chaperone